MDSFQVLSVEKDVDHSQRKCVLSSAEVGTLHLLSVNPTLQEKCWGGRANFPVGSNYSSGQPPDFFFTTE